MRNASSSRKQSSIRKYSSNSPAASCAPCPAPPAAPSCEVAESIAFVPAIPPARSFAVVTAPMPYALRAPASTEVPSPPTPPFPPRSPVPPPFPPQAASVASAVPARAAVTNNARIFFFIVIFSFSVFRFCRLSHRPAPLQRTASAFCWRKIKIFSKIFRWQKPPQVFLRGLEAECVTRYSDLRWEAYRGSRPWTVRRRFYSLSCPYLRE